MFFTLSVMQQPFGTSINIEPKTLKYSSTAAGVTIIVLEAMPSPSRASANSIGPTVPPVGIAILPPKVTL